MAADDVIELSDMQEDIKGVYQRALVKLNKSPHIDGKVAFAEVANNVYPMLDSILTKLAEQEEALMEIAEGGEYLGPETAATIFAALEIGDQLCKFLQAMTNPSGGFQLPEPAASQAHKLVTAYTNGAGLARQAVTELVDDVDAAQEAENPEDDA